MKHGVFVPYKEEELELVIEALVTVHTKEEF